jgi:hypothetical protein
VALGRFFDSYIIEQHRVIASNKEKKTTINAMNLMRFKYPFFNSEANKVK